MHCVRTLKKNAPLLSKKTKRGPSDGHSSSRASNIPDRKRDLGTERQVAIAYGESDPFVPAVKAISSNAISSCANTHVYEFLKALNAVRNGIVSGLLSATNWQVT